MRFCVYCRKEKPRKGFIDVPGPSGAPRGQCADCQDMRRKSQRELEELAKQQRKEKR